MPYPRQDLLPRLVERMEIDGDCWLYRGSLTPSGYGHISVNNQTVPVHRAAYSELVERIPDSLVLDHLCRRPACFNPDHLEPVTQQVNVLRGQGSPATFAARTRCGNGHDFSPANTLQRPNGEGRKCRTCHRNYMRAYRAARKDS